MAALIDLTGRVFGRLTVLGRSGSSASGRVTWRCGCECGNESIATSSNLSSGHTTSCGCAKKSHLPAETAISQAFLNKLFSYDPDSGVLKYRVRSSSLQPGAVAGTVKENRITVCVAGAMFRATHLIWMMTYGKWPTFVIDHINGNPLDNRLANLRDIEQRLNVQNRQHPVKTNKLGLQGVSFDVRRGTYTSALKANGKTVWRGSFSTAEEAHRAYIEAKKKWHPGYVADPKSYVATSEPVVLS